MIHTSISLEDSQIMLKHAVSVTTGTNFHDKCRFETEADDKTATAH
jgi:hypothetical protein